MKPMSFTKVFDVLIKKKTQLDIMQCLKHMYCKNKYLLNKYKAHFYGMLTTSNGAVIVC